MTIGLRTRIFGGFAVVIALILALGAITITALQSIEHDLGDRARAGSAAEAVRAVNAAALNARIAVETWLREPTLEQARVVGERLDRVRAALASAAEREDIAAQGEQIQQVSASLDAYRRSWSEVQNLTRTTDRVWRTAIVERGGRISQELRLLRDMATAQQGSSALESLNRAYDEFTISRLELMRFRATSEAVAHAAALESLETAAREVDKVQLFITEADQVERVEHAFEAINQFRDSATQTKTLVERRQEIVAGFARAGEAIDAAVGAMRASFDEAARQAETAAAGNLAWTNQAVAIAVGGVLALGALLGWLIGRTIAGPIASITSSMETIAGGALDADIPALARRDEMGAMARALQVFRDGLARAK
ncbi:MAG: HAMP domain-containing protein, partial [Alphaproteobacteria bacterium]|nr:HAMP domain-containing protein [Alphaproteobacteria bacterium]